MQLLAITAPLAVYFVFLFHMCDKRKEKERRDKEIVEEMENDDMLLKVEFNNIYEITRTLYYYVIQQLRNIQALYLKIV